MRCVCVLWGGGGAGEVWWGVEGGCVCGGGGGGCGVCVKGVCVWGGGGGGDYKHIHWKESWIVSSHLSYVLIVRSARAIY